MAKMRLGYDSDGNPLFSKINIRIESSMGEHTDHPFKHMDIFSNEDDIEYTPLIDVDIKELAQAIAYNDDVFKFCKEFVKALAVSGINDGVHGAIFPLAADALKKGATIESGYMKDLMRGTANLIEEEYDIF